MDQPKHIFSLDTSVIRTRLIRFLEETKLSQLRVGEMIGRTQGAISAFITGKTNSMHDDAAQKLLKLLDDWETSANIIPFPDESEPRSHPIASDSLGAIRETNVTNTVTSTNIERNIQELRRKVANWLADDSSRTGVLSELERMDAVTLLRLFATFSKPE